MKIENRKTIEKIKETKGWFFEKVNVVDKPLARMTKKKREKMQITKFRDDDMEETTIDPADFKRLIKEHLEHLRVEHPHVRIWQRWNEPVPQKIRTITSKQQYEIDNFNSPATIK